jgi:hypothetical protein
MAARLAKILPLVVSQLAFLTNAAAAAAASEVLEGRPVSVFALVELTLHVLVQSMVRPHLSERSPSSKHQNAPLPIAIAIFLATILESLGLLSLL